MFSVSHVNNPTTSVTAPAEPQKSKKLKSIEISLVIPGVWPAYRGVSKLAASKEEKYIVLAKRILKPIMTPKPAPMDKTKLLDLTFIGTAPFQYLAKQKNVEIFAISIPDINNELNAILMKDSKSIH